MHEYAIFGHDRSAIGRWLGLASILAAGSIGQLLSWMYSISGWEAITKATVTTGLVYFALHWTFNKWIWKNQFFSIPDINGKWFISGKTLHEDGSTKYEWEGELGITQDWKNILIHLKTKNSQSNSYTATISKRYGPCGGWLLSYSYCNEPGLEQSHELNAHKGFCEIEFDDCLKTAKASYFNSRGRRTYGIMNLEKVTK